MNRRGFLAAGGAALTFGGQSAHAAASGRRVFDIYRGGNRIGEHVVTVSRDRGAIRSRVDIDIAVTFLGITAYRYTLDYEETYRNGRLETLTGECDDDGDRANVRAFRAGERLEIDGSAYSGPAVGIAVPTSYWRMAALQATPWISAQSGELLSVSAVPLASSADAPVGARAYRVSDGAGYTVEIWYDAAGEWVGCGFDARDERAIYRLQSGSDPLAGFSL